MRTKTLLRDAIATLVHEKPLDAIAVKEIVARANVGRSAFYAHFRDKDDLLESAIRETLRTCDRGAAAGHAERVLRFARPLLEHVERAGLPGGATPGSAAHTALHERVRGVLVEHVRGTLARVPSAVPPDLLAEHVAETFLRVLAWWATGERARSAAEADATFRALVLPALDDALRSRP